MEKRLVCLIVPETKYCKDIVFFNVVEEIMRVTLSKQRQGRCTAHRSGLLCTNRAEDVLGNNIA